MMDVTYWNIGDNHSQMDNSWDSLPASPIQMQVMDSMKDLNQSVIAGFLLSIVAIGILANTLIIYVMSSDPRLHRAPFYFLVCVSVMDFSKCIFCLPFAIEVAIHNFSWEYGRATCTVLAFSNSFFTYASAIGFLVISVDRYLATTATRFYNKHFHGRVSLLIIFVGWGAAFCLSFPPIFEHGAYRYIPTEMQCTFYHLPYRENETLGYSIAFVCVLTMMLFLYCRLFLFMRSHRRMAPLFHEPARSRDWTFFGPGANGQALINMLNGFAAGTPNPYATNVNNIQQNVGRMVNLRVLRNEHITRLFFVAGTCFIGLWAPYLIQSFIQVFNETIHLPATVIVLTVILSNSHVAICPVVCLLFGSPLRASLFAKAKQCCHNNQMYHNVSLHESEVQEPNVRCIELRV